jgi:phage terminase large subunit
MTGRTVSCEVPEWAEPLESAGPNVRSLAVWSGRGAGKSRWAASWLVRKALQEPDESTLLVRETMKSINESSKAEVVNAIRVLGVEDQFEVQDARIRHRHGRGVFTFIGLQNHSADAVKSLSGYKRAWVEEAANLSRTSLEVLTPTIRLPGSQIVYTWNPRWPDDPVDEMFRCNSEAAKERGQQPPASAVVATCSYESNPWFADPLLTEMRECQARDLDAWRHIWQGHYIQATEARVFRNVKVQAFETPKSALFLFGLDFGFAANTHLVRCYIEGRTLYIDQEAVRARCEIDDLAGLVGSIEGAEKWTIVADSASPQLISHLNRKGFKVVPSIKGAGSVEAGVEFLRSLSIVIHPRCATLISEFARFAYKIDKRTQRIVPQLDWTTFHPDGIPAAMYAVESVRRGIGGKLSTAPSPPPTIAHRW